MLKLIQNGEVLSPQYIGKKDILLTDRRIGFIEDKINISGLPVSIDVEVIDASDCYIVPGFIDSHVHIIGGGGEGGFKTRTPEIQLSDITRGGITTLIGCLGTDSTTRCLPDLLAKARALDEEGITTYMYTGSYQYPIRTITGNIEDDIILIDKIIGVGELALEDHRSSQPTLEEVMKVAAAARVGGILSGKAGVVNVHMGKGERQVDFLVEIGEKSEIPLKQFLPTHMNRNKSLLNRSISYALRGGLVDLTTSSGVELLPEDETKCSNALALMLENDVPVENITFSSDGQGSLPEFNEEGELIGLKVGKVTTLYGEVRDAILYNKVGLETAIKVITSNPAEIFKLETKGEIKTGKDADIVLLDKDSLKIKTVLAGGEVMVKDDKIVTKGTFE